MIRTPPPVQLYAENSCDENETHHYAKILGVSSEEIMRSQSRFGFRTTMVRNKNTPDEFGRWEEGGWPLRASHKF
ncbi:MAG: hypothetical protein WBB98_11265 [Xanthobacteraceae bacterium]